jgi:hypothetical protein
MPGFPGFEKPRGILPCLDLVFRGSWFDTAGSWYLRYTRTTNRAACLHETAHGISGIIVKEAG